MVVDGDPCGRRRWCGEWWLPTSLASNLGCNWVQCDEGMMADPILHLDDDGGERWWCSMASQAAEEAGASRARRKCVRRVENGAGFCSCSMTHRDKACHPRGAVGTGSDRLCRAHRAVSAITAKW
jgi:hypothetical protein